MPARYTGETPLTRNNIYITRQTKRLIEAEARRLGMSFSQYIERSILKNIQLENTVLIDCPYCGYKNRRKKLPCHHCGKEF